MPITVTVNGAPRAMDDGATVLALIQALGLDPMTVAVEHNGAILDRSQHAETPLVDGDTLELVRFVGGG